jgi:hypothetical protein
MNNPPAPNDDDASTKPIPESLALSARELLIRTGELPRTKRELLVVLSEYRATVHALVAATGQL